MTTEANTKTGFLTYSHTIGLSTMQDRGLYCPSDTALGPDGRMYTTNRSVEGEPRGLRVTVYDIDSNYYGVIGRAGTGDGEFIWPTAVAVDSENLIYVADEHNHQISVFEPSLAFLRAWGTKGSAEGEINGPSGLALDKEDRLYVVDHMNHRVQKFTGEGVFLSAFGSFGDGDGEFNLPWGITVAPSGEVYVADWRNNRIQRFTTEGEFIAKYGSSGDGEGEFERPTSVAVDADGYIYVCDWGNERLQVLDRDGGFVAMYRGEATDSKWAQDFLSTNVEEARARAESDLEPVLEGDDIKPAIESAHVEKLFFGLTSVVVDNEGYVYLTESDRHRVQIYRRS